MSLSTLQDFRNHARTVFDLDTTDVSDLTLDRWIKTAYARVLRSRKSWPHLEATTTLSVVSGTQSYAMPTADSTTLRHIIFVEFEDRQLMWEDHGTMLRRYHSDLATTSATPQFYSQFNRRIYIWPTPSVTATATIYGVREPDLTWLASASGTPDLPEYYDAPMMSWVLSEVAKQQNDLNQANNFAQDFEIELMELNATEINPPLDQPIIMNGGIAQPRWGWPWVSDVAWP